MGNLMPPPQGSQDIVVLQLGLGFHCDCGPPRFVAESAANDQRLLARKTQQDVRAKFEALNNRAKKIKPPIYIILPWLITGLVVMVIFQVLPIMRNQSEKDYGGRHHDGGYRNDTNTHEDKEDDPPSILDILRYMGGIVTLIIMIPGFVIMCRKRKEAQTMIEEFFQDWVSDGTLVKATYYPGSKHAQPRVILTVSAGQLIAQQVTAVATVVSHPQTGVVLSKYGQSNMQTVPSIPHTETVVHVKPMPTPKHPDV